MNFYNEIDPKEVQRPRKVCWYRNGMNKHLSGKGYVHFCARVPMDEDFKEGIPYTFNESEKTFGKADLVSNAEDAKRITENLIAEIQSNVKEKDL